MTKLGHWLDELGLRQHEALLAANDIDFDTLRHLTDQDLKDLGLSLGHRRKLFAAIAALPPLEGPSRFSSPQAAAASAPDRRQLTVLFCDLVDSTALSARLDPEDLSVVLRAYRECCATALARFDGHIAKYLGDGILAYFGYPRAHEDDAERAVRAGLGILGDLDALGAHVKLPLHVRVGIATGSVMVGELIGTGAAQEQTVVGETPNLAARILSFAEPDTVLIASSTRRLIGGLFDCIDLGSRHIKGLPKALRVWRVRGESGVESRFDALHAGDLTPLVGREQELALLIERWSRAKEGDGQVVLLCGEPGIGKSRITEALCERLRTEPHRRLRYYCSPYHQNSALYPVIQQIERAAHIVRGDPPEQELTKLEALLSLSANNVVEVAPLFAGLLSISAGDRYPSLNLSPQRQKEKTLEALVDQLSGLATAEPVLLVWEDAHWADPTSLELLDLVIDRVQKTAVLAIITFRPEFTTRWTGYTHVTSLALNRLSRKQAAAMIDHVTAGKALPREVSEQIVAKTDGVPLFVEELTKTVLESGLLKDAGNCYAVSGPLPSLAIPTTLQDSLLARLDRLAPVKAVAQVGAVIGREFSYKLLAAMMATDESELQIALQQLTTAELIFRRGNPPNATYAFKHALVQDAAYMSLLKSRRKELHARIAQILEDRSVGGAETLPEVIAHHFTEASLIQPAVDHWLRAGERALQRSEYLEAVSHLTKGLEVQRDLPLGADRARQELAFQTALGTALRATKGYGAEDTGRAFARAHELCEELGDAPQLFPVLYGLWAYQMTRGRYQLVRDLSQQFLTQATMRQDAAAILVGHRQAGLSDFVLGDLSHAKEHFDHTLALYDATQHRSLALQFAQDPRVCCLSNFAWLKWVLGWPDSSLAMSCEALTYARELGHVNTNVYAGFAALAILQFRRDAPAIEAQAASLIALCEERQMSMWRAWAAIIQGWAIGQRGNSELALDQMRKRIADLRTSGQEFWLPYFLSLQAEILALCAQTEAGLDSLAEALALVDSTMGRWWEAEIHRLKGEMIHLQLRHQDQRVEEEFTIALRIARSHGAKSLELRAASSLARLWAERGEKQRAFNLLAPIHGWFTEGFETADLKHAKSLLEQLGCSQMVLN